MKLEKHREYRQQKEMDMEHYRWDTVVDNNSGEGPVPGRCRRQGGVTRKIIRGSALVLVLLLLSEGTSQAKTYKVDESHTSVTFSVRHLFTQVQGRFDRFEGRIVFDPEKPENTIITGSIDTASINTNVAKRDEHLRTSDFFHVDKHPRITFKSTGVSSVDRKTRTAKIEGDLTIRGVTRRVVLDTSYLGSGKDPWGNERAGFSASVTIM